MARNYIDLEISYFLKLKSLIISLFALDFVYICISDTDVVVYMMRTSFFGVMANTFIALYIRRLSMLRNSFGRLLQLQAIGDAVFASVWAFYFAPTLFFLIIYYYNNSINSAFILFLITTDDIKALQNLEIASRFGQLCLICYDISIYSHLIISFNRKTITIIIFLFTLQRLLKSYMIEMCNAYI
uniref:7TM_GPCR_Srx domain-containing protein n=1 Tax=Heterorhabditis bacteriophora TaxID=37862 RepID=A0A1I7WX52_HETBA